MDRASELTLGERSREMPIGGDDHRHSGKRPRQHLRLITRPLDRFEHALAVTDHQHTIFVSAAAVTPAEDRRALASFEHQTRECRDDRRLSAAADDKVADADHRLAERARTTRNALVP